MGDITWHNGGTAGSRTFCGFNRGSSSPYHQVVTLAFDSLENAQAGLQSSEGQAAVQDLANFATGGVTVLLGPTQSLA